MSAELFDFLSPLQQTTVTATNISMPVTSSSESHRSRIQYQTTNEPLQSRPTPVISAPTFLQPNQGL